MPHPITHVEFQVRDVQEAMQWYADLFGWQTSYDAATNYGSFKTDEQHRVGGGLNLITEHPVGTIAYVQTDNLESMLQKAQAMGARLVQDATAVPGKGTYALISDPDGNAIGLWQEA